MLQNRTAFTMMELVFVIVVLGILASVAIPRLTATRDDAQITKGRADIATIRSGIITERQQRLFRGDSTFAPNLDSASTAEGQQLFTVVLNNPVISKQGDGHWMKTAGGYTYQTLGVDVAFTYDSNTGVFDCTHSVNACQLLTE